LAPSPTAAILLPSTNILRILTISAFWVGLHQQTHTHGAKIAT